MKDSLALLATAIVASAGAWAFWHYLGFEVGATLVLLMLAAGGAGKGLLRGRRRRRRE